MYVSRWFCVFASESNHSLSIASLSRVFRNILLSGKSFCGSIKILYELFGKGEFFLYLCGEIPNTIPIPLL